MFSSSKVPSHGVPAHANSVPGSDGRSGTGTAAQAIPARVDNTPFVAAGAAPAVMPLTIPALPRELWWLLPADSRRPLQADYARHGEALLDPDHMIGNASEAQLQARADYFALADHCSAGPCFVQSTSRLEMNSTASPPASLTFWCRLEVGSPWVVLPLSLQASAWVVQITEPDSRLAGLNGRCVDNLEQVVGVMHALGMREVLPDASAMDDASVPRNCMHRAVLRLVRLCNGGTSS